MNNQNQSSKIIYVLGLFPVIWIALLIAPSFNGGIPSIIKDFPIRMENPFSIAWCNDSLKVILLFSAIYVLAIGIYLSTKKNYRRGEEHGSASWGDLTKINKKYEQHPFSSNKILTQNVSIGYDAKKHRRNLNTLVIG